MLSNNYNLAMMNEFGLNAPNYVIGEDIKNIMMKMSKELGKPISSFESRQSTGGFGINKNFGNSNSNTGFKPNHQNQQQQQQTIQPKKRMGKNVEITDDSEWERIVPFKTTPIFVQKEGVDGLITQIRINLNKLTDKNYATISFKIMEIIDGLVEGDVNGVNLQKVGKIIFEIASNNRFYSKIYADFYSGLIQKYEVMKLIFQSNCDDYFSLFDKIEYVDSVEDYDRFCAINKINESRKAISEFFLNLVKNKIMTRKRLFGIIVHLFQNIVTNIHIERKTNEVNEMVENFIILFDLPLFNKYKDELVLYDDTVSIVEVIQTLAETKSKDEFPSLSVKTRFKFLSFVEDKLM
jgi:hypothetical protein